jgi:hypothetical protein
MKHFTFAAVLSVGFLLGSAPGAFAQQYRFQVERMDLHVFVQPDASARLEYEIDFVNQPGVSPIDVVDVGLPHSGYSLASMSASCDGHPLTGIRKSSYISVGVEVPLAPRPIQPGTRGAFRFQCTMPDMVYQDTTAADRAALQIRPTWFDPNLQVGRTRLRIAVHLLPGIKAEEVKYHQEATRYTTLVQDQKDAHLVAVWEFPEQLLSEQNPKVGISFPQRGLQRVVKLSAVGLLVKWFSERPTLQLWSGVALIGLFLFLFFRFSYGTGWVLGLALAGGLGVMMAMSPALHLLAWPVVVGLTALNEWYLDTRKSRSYLPAMATVEGGGIKRGLTAPQAAVLLERPVKQVLTLVIFGLLKKGFLRLVQDDPLTVEVVPELRCARRARQREAARQGTTIHGYEQPFVDLLQAHTGPVAECDLTAPVRGLIRSTAERMKGFDLAETKAYYLRIVQQAWKEAESIGEIPQRTEVVNRNLDWMLLDGNWGGRFTTWHDRGYHYRPNWFPRGAIGGGAASDRGGSSTSSTSLGEVAASFAGWAENTGGRLASAIEPSGLYPGAGHGVLDLSVVDSAAASFFEQALSSSGGRGGGGGGCACAGCACACACAGGGR